MEGRPAMASGARYAGRLARTCGLGRRCVRRLAAALASPSPGGGGPERGALGAVNKAPQLFDGAAYEYVLRNTREHPALRRLRDRTSTLRGAQMQVPPEQGALLGFLVELLGARTVVEVGTYTGYSAACMALAIGDGGTVITLERSRDSLEVAKEAWEDAGVAHVIDARLGDAHDTLDAMVASGELAGRVDIAFVDADKRGYMRYYERLLELLRPGGVIAVDNTLWYGKVADPSVDDKQTVALREFNAHVLEDMRVSHALLPVGDGITLLRKR